jgi:hypothetical protein
MTYRFAEDALAEFIAAGRCYNWQVPGLVMVPVSFDSRPGELGRHPPSADLVFRALKPGDPDIKRPNVEGPDRIIRVQER